MPNACFIESAPLGVGTERNSKQAAMGLVDLNPRPVVARRPLYNNQGCLKSGWWDLNPRPPGPEPGALPS